MLFLMVLVYPLMDIDLLSDLQDVLRSTTVCDLLILFIYGLDLISTKHVVLWNHIYTPVIMAYRRTMRRVRRSSRRSGVPRVSKRDSNTVRLEKANFDVRPMLYTTYIEGAGNWTKTIAAAATEADFCTVPLYNFVNNAAIFANGLAKMYTDYRVKKCTVHCMLLSVSISVNTIGN